MCAVNEAENGRGWNWTACAPHLVVTTAWLRILDIRLWATKDLRVDRGILFPVTIFQERLEDPAI